ncbi:Engulfment and cell motility protein 1 [Golovinomyces cichoracearum]|uniref:Engulfment and cell motility protein 1 n=1 Tax=Golovinomyces cichoracearum TaxID=62708 RepID=A0A420HJZ2_9PEZI|nr:Engulfment and cell motility protein 1 [Golovinomyces cichoracearum]
MDQADIPDLLTSLQSNEDAIRKLAAFKLQTSINDPSLADVFISSGGLQVLCKLIMDTNGNTLAYSLAALSRLLEVEMGWEIFELDGAGALIERIVGLIVTHPLVNTLRGAISVLVAVVCHSQSSRDSVQAPDKFGFRALEPAIAVYPQFFEMVVSQLNSADHLLCANSLMLLNALIRDTVSRKEFSEEKTGKSNVSVAEWRELISKLEELGIVQAAYNLMQSSSLQDMAHPLLEFQTVSKLLLKKRREIEIDLQNVEHQGMLEKVFQSSQEKEGDVQSKISRISETEIGQEQDSKKWRRIGFQSENPVLDFEHTGFLGMMDLVHFVTNDKDNFQKLIKEQYTRPVEKRCPIARASLSVTEILYKHFEIDRTDLEDPKTYLTLDAVKNYEKLLKPFVLQWSRIHEKALNSFISLWKQVEADQEEFTKVVELLHILVEKVLAEALRTKDIQEIEEELSELDYQKLREFQIDMMNTVFEDEWGQHLSQIRGELRNEALQFLKEQRIRILLQGSWFFLSEANHNVKDAQNEQASPPTWRYVKLSHNRRYLHYSDFETRAVKDPVLDNLNEKIDLRTVSSVVSNVSETNNKSSGISTLTTEINTLPSETQPILTRITVKGYINTLDSETQDSDLSNAVTAEKPLLVLLSDNHSVASAWLDGLLMLLNQAPITSETNELIDFVCDYGLKIKLLNVRMEDFMDPPDDAGVIPSREGLDEDYFYDI